MKHATLLTIILITSMYARTQNTFAGLWEGKLSASVEFRMVFNIYRDANGSWSAKMDVPDQGIKGIVSNHTSIEKDSLFISFKQFQGTYSGKLSSDSLIDGQWSQGVPIALQLRRVNRINELTRPQTPVPPFSYASEDIVFFNEQKSIQYGATITIPKGKGPFPAVVLITGSGQQNRDEETMGHKPFAVIADHLTKNNFIVLRMDDRGIGQTTGNIFSATTLDFCDDISTGLNYLLSRQEVDKKRLGLIGHSEGGMIAPMLATKRNDIAAIVLLAAPGRNNIELLTEQNEAILTADGLPEEYVKEYLRLYSSLLLLIRNASDLKTARTTITDTVDSWLKRTPKDIVIATTGINDDQKRMRYIDGMVAISGSPWFQYFLSYDPQNYLEKLRCNVFALNGKKDIQIISASNLRGIEGALKQSQAKHFQVKEYEGLNHLFQKCKACTINEYGILEETFSVEVLNDITVWLKEYL